MATTPDRSLSTPQSAPRARGSRGKDDRSCTSRPATHSGAGRHPLTCGSTSARAAGARRIPTRSCSDRLDRHRIDRPSDRCADGLPGAMAAARMRANGRSRVKRLIVEALAIRGPPVRGDAGSSTSWRRKHAHPLLEPGTIGGRAGRATPGGTAPRAANHVAAHGTLLPGRSKTCRWPASTHNPLWGSGECALASRTGIVGLSHLTHPIGPDSAACRAREARAHGRN